MTAPILPKSQIVEETAAIWGTALHPAGCPACQRVYLIEDSRLGQDCPLCARAKLQAQPALLRPEAPELLWPFRYEINDLRPRLEKFVSEVWLRNDDFETGKLLQRAAPIYWPVWLVDADVVGGWQAEAGFDYQVKSSQESYGTGGWSTREVVETRIRWEPRAGQIRRRYDNIVSPALSEQNRLLKLTGPYQYNQAQAYQSEQLRGAVLCVPDLPPESAWPLSQARLDEAAAEECRQAAGAEHIRNFLLNANYESLHWTQQLMPVYVTWYHDDDGNPQIVFVNGQSGAIGGARLASQKKGWRMVGMVLLVAGLVFLAALLFGLVGLFFPVSMLLAGFLGVLSMLVACLAIVPAVWPWQWNRGRK